MLLSLLLKSFTLDHDLWRASRENNILKNGFEVIQSQIKYEKLQPHINNLTNRFSFYKE